MLATVLAAGLTGVQAAVSLPFLVEAGMGLLPFRAGRPSEVQATPVTTVLMPAHDEGPYIAAILAALLPGLPANARVLVVADNCTDDTAARARAAGAEVIERHDPLRRGKGFALAFGRDHLAAAPPEVVVVLDADCTVEPGGIAHLAALSHGRQAPVQGVYLLAPRPDAAPMVQISSFAMLVKNLVRQRGLVRIGASLPLGGTGMAFPWGLFRDAALATGDLVEDLALSVELVRAGHPTLLDPVARIWSDPASAQATLGQRARWEGGFASVARRYAPGLLGGGIARRSWPAFWMGLHVATPPLALLILCAVVLAGTSAGLMLLGASGVPALVSLALLLAIGAVVLAAWMRFGRPWLRPGTLARVPLYVLWKVPLYLRLALRRGPRAWVRTERN